MKPKIKKYCIYIFILTGLVSKVGLSQKPFDDETYRIIRVELDSHKYTWINGVMEHPYTEFKLHPPPPANYHGFDSTMINYLIVKAELDHSEVGNLQNQIDKSKSMKWDSSLLKRRIIKEEDLDSIKKLNELNFGFVKISSPLYSSNGKTMILVFEFANKIGKGYLAIIYKKQNNSWIEVRRIKEE